MTAHGFESHTTEFDPDDIDLGTRLRAIDPDHVAFIAESIRDAGQLQAVVVRPPVEGTNGHVRLIVGAHRVEACRLLGRKVRVVVRPLTDDQAALAEIDENLARHDLTELDRAAFIAVRKDIYLRAHPEAGQGKAKKGKPDKNVPLVPSFAEDLAGRLNIDARTVNRAVRRYRDISPEVRRRIAGTWLARRGVELDALARLPQAEQMARVVAVLDDKTATSIRAAARAISRGGEPISPEEKQRQRMLAMLRRLSATLRGEAMEWLRQAAASDRKEAARKARRP